MKNNPYSWKFCKSCGKKTKRVWKYKGLILCYVCYYKEFSKRNREKLFSEDSRKEIWRKKNGNK